MPLLRQRCQLAPGLDGPSAPPLHPTRHSSGQKAGPSGLTAGLLRALQLCLGPLVSPSQTHPFCPRLQRLHLFPSGGIRWSRDRVREHREKMSFQPQKTPQDSLYHYKVGTGASEPGGQSHVPSCWQASANKNRMTDSSGEPGALRGAFGRSILVPSSITGSISPLTIFAVPDLRLVSLQEAGSIPGPIALCPSCGQRFLTQGPLWSQTQQVFQSWLKCATWDVGHMDVHISKLSRTSQNTALGHAAQRHLLRLLQCLFSFT